MINNSKKNIGLLDEEYVGQTNREVKQNIWRTSLGYHKAACCGSCWDRYLKSKSRHKPDKYKSSRKGK